MSGTCASSIGQGWIAQLDLTRETTDPLYAQHFAYDFGQVRSFAYDASRRRLYVTHTVTADTTTLRYVDLRDGCGFDLTQAGACGTGLSRALPRGLELESIALANDTGSGSPVRRAYLSARIYDAAAAASSGFRVGDFDGLLLVVDLSEDAAGQLRVDIVDDIAIGYGAAYVRVLPLRPGKRDVVAVLAAGDGVVWIYDDETGASTAIGRECGDGQAPHGRGPVRPRRQIRCR